MYVKGVYYTLPWLQRHPLPMNSTVPHRHTLILQPRLRAYQIQSSLPLLYTTPPKIASPIFYISQNRICNDVDLRGEFFEGAFRVLEKACPRESFKKIWKRGFEPPTPPHWTRHWTWLFRGWHFKVSEVNWARVIPRQFVPCVYVVNSCI